VEYIFRISIQVLIALGMSLKGQKVVSEWVLKKLKPSVPFHVHLEVGYIFRISIQVSGFQFRFQDLNPGPNQLRDVPQGPKTLFWGYFGWFLQT
jgi:hypothetical protein